MTLRLVVFDVDGTLVDSQGHIKAAMARAFAAVGLPDPGPEATLSIVGLSLPQALARLAPEAGEDTQARMVEAYRQAFFDLHAGTAPAPLYPGAREVLEALAPRDDLLLGIATGKSRRGLDHILEAHDLKRFFVTEQVADHHPSKPHPSMLLTALAETGVQAEDAVMVGDTSFDMDMARAARMCALGVDWGYHPSEQLTRAEAVLSSFGELPGTLARIWGDDT